MSREDDEIGIECNHRKEIYRVEEKSDRGCVEVRKRVELMDKQKGK